MLLVLTQAEIFKAVPRPYLAALAQRCQIRAFRAGETLMREGEVSDAMHLLVTGRVRVQREIGAAQTETLAELGAGEAVGEMGVLDHRPRSATVVALVDTVAVELTARAFEQTLAEFPDATTAVLRVLNRRPREEQREPSES